MNIDKKEIVNEINNLTHQKYQIEQQLSSLQKQYSELLKPECEQYIGKCYKQYIEDNDYSETVYYKILDIYSEEDDFERFKLHASLYKAIKILTEMTEVEENQRKEYEKNG